MVTITGERTIRATRVRVSGRAITWGKNIAAFALVEAIGLALVVMALDGVNLANLPW